MLYLFKAGKSPRLAQASEAGVIIFATAPDLAHG
jgi:hypothetical protein